MKTRISDYLIGFIVVFIDFLKILLGKFKDKDGLYLTNWLGNKS